MQDKVTQAWRSSVYNPTMPTKKLRKNFYIHILDTFLGGQIIFPTQANENIGEKEPLPTKKNNLQGTARTEIYNIDGTKKRSGCAACMYMVFEGSQLFKNWNAGIATSSGGGAMC